MGGSALRRRKMINKKDYSQMYRTSHALTAAASRPRLSEMEPKWESSKLPDMRYGIESVALQK